MAEIQAPAKGKNVRSAFIPVATPMTTQHDQPPTGDRAGLHKTGVILIHGIGQQNRYDYTKSFSSALYREIKSIQPGAELQIDRTELARMPARTRETSDLFSFFGPGGTLREDAHKHLFRPVCIVDRDHEIAFYEVYWADEDLKFSWFQKLKFNVWLTTTLWNPLFNALSRKYAARSVSPFQFLRYWFALGILDFVIHMAESILVLFAFVARKTEPLRRFGEIIFEYAGDVKLYYSPQIYFHNQTKLDVLMARFDEVLLKANLDGCDSIHIAAHSLGSVLAYDGLHSHRVEPAKMSLDFLDYLKARMAGGEPLFVDPYEKLKTLVTLGSPLDKTYFVFPSARPMAMRRKIRLSLAHPANGETAIVAEDSGPAEASFEWHNINDISDPLGDRLAWYGSPEAPVASTADSKESAPRPPAVAKDPFPTVENHRQAHAWWPHTAHNNLHHNPDVIGWLARRFAGKRPAALGEAGLASRFVRIVWVSILASVSFAVLCFGFFWMLDLALGTAHDLYADAESHTIFSKLQAIDGWIAAARSQLDLTRGSEWRWLTRPVVVTVEIFVIFFLIALIPAWLRYGYVERLRASRRRTKAEREEAIA